MIIKPKTRGFICTTAHPLGCREHVFEQVRYLESQSFPAEKKPKTVLVLGCSTGYGLASRLACAFGFGAETLGVMFEKPPTEKRTASAGWYNTAALEEFAQDKGIKAQTLNLDAFSHEAKEAVIKTLKENFSKVDLVVYSLASPRRKDPDSGEVFSSTLKPIGNAVTMKTLDTDRKIVHDVTLEPASEKEIADTVKVMGGEDWELWMDALMKADVLAEGVKTVAYTYIGKSLTWPIYGHASIGKAKEDLDRAAHGLKERLGTSLNGEAHVAVLKAVVTQSSSAIPVMPLYISLLYQVMKNRHVHEGCIEQIYSLIANQLYSGGNKELDDAGRIRVDLKELEDEVQNEVKALWAEVSSDNIDELSDFQGYQREFFKLFGFGYENINYEIDCDPMVVPKSLSVDSLHQQS